MSENEKVYMRLALREEGKFWNAYLAKDDGMKDSLLIASVLMKPIKENPQLKEDFMKLARAIISDAIEGALGVGATWNDPEPAPESERAGRA